MFPHTINIELPLSCRCSAFSERYEAKFEQLLAANVDKESDLSKHGGAKGKK
jgi:hypothetical protein